MKGLLTIFLVLFLARPLIAARSGCTSISVLDVVFVIDTSGSIGSSRFQLIREVTANVTTELILNSPQSSVGVISFDRYARIQFGLQTHTNLSSLLSAINNLPYYDGSSTDTDEALTLLLSAAQNGLLGLRNDSSKVAIVITDGESRSKTATLSAATALHASNIFDVYAVGVDGANLLELQGIASSPDFVFFTSSFNSSSLQQLQQDRLLPQLCGEPFQADIVTRPPGVPVNKDNNTFGYLIGSNLSLTCSVTPILPVNLDSSFSWNCSTGCFADMRMEQTINVTNLDTMDNGSITCSFTFDNVDYHSDPLNLLVSDFFSSISVFPTERNVGDPQDVICIVASTSGLDDADSVIGSWTGPNGVITNDDRVTINTTIDNNIYTSILHFNYIMESDEGIYYCNVTTIDLDLNVSLTANITNLTIPDPTVDTTVPNNLTTGQSVALDCSAVTVKGITSRVYIVWYSGGQVKRLNNNVTASIINDTAAVYRDSFNISSLTGKHDNRVYSCQIIINSDPLIAAISSVRLNVTYVCVPDGNTLCLYPYGYGAGDLALPTSLPSGEGYSPAIYLRQNLHFFGQSLQRVYINDNGIISFNSRYNVRTPLPLPLRYTYRIIAPYWADVDTRGTGKIYYRQTSDPILLAKATREIQQGHPDSENTNITNLLIVTWNAVGYYFNKTDKTNTFQCVLASSTSESYAIFLYEDLQWTTGDDSGGRNGLHGTEALVGFNVGDRVNSITVPGSRMPNITNIASTSNIGIPGIWTFKTYEPLCRPETHTCVSEFYPFGVAQGDTALPPPTDGEGSSPPITLNEDFVFYDDIIRTAYINDNGVISFNNSYNVRTPLALPLSGTQQIIAPYWADVDTSGTGQIFYRQSTDPSLLARASREIQTAIHPSQNVNITNLLIATWDEVGYYDGKIDKKNTFQCILATTGNASFVIFMYADGRMQWTTGDYSGGYNGIYGTPALAGINAGNGIDNYVVSGSRSYSISGIARTTNVDVLGTYIFKVGEICETEVRTCKSELYPFGYTNGDVALLSYYYSEASYSSAITLTKRLFFYDEIIRTAYVGNNGIISFNIIWYYTLNTPFPLPSIGAHYKIIAPYWADVDTRGTGQIFYRQTTNATLLSRVTREIQAAFSDSENVTIQSLLIATWNNVGYYASNTDKTNTFQCVLASSETESYVIFLYADLQWTTGDNSGGDDGFGGTEALAGFNAGDGINSITVPGSLTPNIINLVSTSNVGNPGVWIFKLGEDDCQPSVGTCVSEFYPFGRTQNDVALLKSFVGEISSQSIHLSEGFYFFDKIVTDLYINDNGIISFNNSYNVRTPLPLPLNGTQQIIAPYWADVDTSGTGEVYYRQSTDPSLLARATREIQEAFPTSEISVITNLLIATWVDVGYYYQKTDKINTFQCILATNEIESFVIFMYADERMEWTTGDWSGGSDGLSGTEALAGINAGDQINHITIPGSQTPEIINITSTSNIGIPGTWMFKVGGVIKPDVTVETSDEQLLGQSLTMECRIGPAYDIYINSTFDIIWTKESAMEVRRVENISGSLLSNYSDYYVIQTLRAGDAYTSYRCDVLINFTRPLNASATIILENLTQPPKIIISPLQSPLKVSVGSHLPLYCTAVAGFPIPEVQWHSEGFPVYPPPQAYQQIYLVPTDSPHETTYTCVGTYKQGVKVSELRINVTVIVYERCSSLKKPKNGKVMMTEDKMLAYFSCNRGYTMRGSPVTKCINGEWNYSPPTCHAISNFCRRKCEF